MVYTVLLEIPEHNLIDTIRYLNGYTNVNIYNIIRSKGKVLVSCYLYNLDNYAKIKYTLNTKYDSNINILRRENK